MKRRIILQALASIFLALLFYKGLAPFLSGVITVQAILIGFSFSVMFFLASSKNDDPTEIEEIENLSIERKIRDKTALKVAGEVFKNLAYFNLVCLCSLIISLTLLLPPISTTTQFLYKMFSEKYEPISVAFHLFGYAVWIVLSAAFYFLVIESTYTFARITTRINFLFDHKIRPQ